MNTYEEERKIAIENINNMNPIKPKFFKKDDIRVVVVLLIITIYFLLMTTSGNVLCTIIFIGFFGLDIFLAIGFSQIYKESYTKYKFMRDDFEKYKQEEIEKINNYFDNKDNNDKILDAQVQYMKEQAKQKRNNIPKCPTCGSTDISDISTIKRAIGITTVGLASSDLGKTRKCNHCGYKW